jgi:hypothetical protein
MRGIDKNKKIINNLLIGREKLCQQKKLRKKLQQRRPQKKQQKRSKKKCCQSVNGYTVSRLTAKHCQF